MGRLIIHAMAVAAVLIVWEELARIRWLDPSFFGSPTGILHFIWANFFLQRRLWVDLGYTLFGATASFALGSGAAFLCGLVFSIYPRMYKALEPYFTLLNAMPRIALAPLFILWFGLGVSSKIAVGFSICFFIVLTATIAGMRSASSDHLVLSRAMGGSPTQIFLKVTLPSAVPVIFSALRLSAIYALIGVVGSELIAAERGLGQSLAYLQSTFQIDGVIALLFILSLVGLVVTTLMEHIERRLLKWQ
jgi:NitT/TauT family transport system permease protein